MSQAVLCLSYLRPDYLERLSQTLPADVTTRILVNNGGDEPTRKVAAKHGWTVFEPGENLSYSAGNNRAAQACPPDVTHFVLINNDLELRPGCLAALWERRHLPVVGCVIVRTDGSMDHAGVAFRMTLPGVGQYGLQNTHFGFGGDPATITHDRWAPAVTFACVQIRRDIWQQVGGLDEGYWYGWEDVDFCLRVLEQTGQRACVAHDARAIHDQLGTRTQATDPPNFDRFAARWFKNGTFLRDCCGLVF